MSDVIHDLEHPIDTPANRIDLTVARDGAVIALVADDLPCPWCGEATLETDNSCRGCRRRFG